MMVMEQVANQREDLEYIPIDPPSSNIEIIQEPSDIRRYINLVGSLYLLSVTSYLTA